MARKRIGSVKQNGLLKDKNIPLRYIGKVPTNADISYVNSNTDNGDIILSGSNLKLKIEDSYSTMLTSSNTGIGLIRLLSDGLGQEPPRIGEAFINDSDEEMEVSFWTPSGRDGQYLEAKSVYVWTGEDFNKTGPYIDSSGGGGGSGDVVNIYDGDSRTSPGVTELIITEGEQKVIIGAFQYPDGSYGPTCQIERLNPSGYAPSGTMSITIVKKTGVIDTADINNFKTIINYVINNHGYGGKIDIWNLLYYATNYYPDDVYITSGDAGTFSTNSLAIDSDVYLSFSGLSGLEIKLTTAINGMKLYSANKRSLSIPEIEHSANLPLYTRVLRDFESNKEGRSYGAIMTPAINMVGAKVQTGLVPTVITGSLVDRRFSGSGVWSYMADYSTYWYNDRSVYYYGDIFKFSSFDYNSGMTSGPYVVYDTSDPDTKFIDDYAGINGLYYAHTIFDYNSEDDMMNNRPSNWYGSAGHISAEKYYLTRNPWHPDIDTSTLSAYSALGPFAHAMYRYGSVWHMPITMQDNGESYMRFVFNDVSGLPKIIEGYTSTNNDYNVSCPHLNSNYLKYVEIEVKNTDDTENLSVSTGDGFNKVIVIKPGDHEYIKIERRPRNEGYGPTFKMWYSSEPLTGGADVSLVEIGIHNDESL